MPFEQAPTAPMPFVYGFWLLAVLCVIGFFSGDPPDPFRRKDLLEEKERKKRGKREEKENSGEKCEFTFAGVVAVFFWTMFGATCGDPMVRRGRDVRDAHDEFALFALGVAIVATTLFLMRLHAMLAAIYWELRSLRRADALHRARGV